MIAEPWASVVDIAPHLGVAKDAIYRWIDKKGLPAHTMGSRWEFKVSDVDGSVRQGGAAQRHKPTIEWSKDRGTDPNDAPRYALGPACGESKGTRVNDHILSLATKRAASVGGTAT